MSIEDLHKKERNERIRELTEKINSLVPDVLSITQYESIHSLNATFGGKMQQYANVKYYSFDNHQSFILKYIEGFFNIVSNLDPLCREESPYYRAFMFVHNNEVVRNWLYLFLERAFLKYYDEYTRKKPSEENSLIWIGQEHASYGIAITPRFNEKTGQWENDKSQIRRFPQQYFSIGHILETGFLIPFKNERITFTSLDQFLSFFSNTLVRLSGSPHEKSIAERYCEYVRSHGDSNSIPLLIPELRYNGIEREHKYRLDFCILDYVNSIKVGFELSPWSTHGRIVGTKDKTQKVINEEAQSNYYHEVMKMREYFYKFGITVVTYTDQDLNDYDALFSDISKYLSLTGSPTKMLSNADLILDYSFA